jgi:lipid A 4'-phosphatase
LLAAIVLASIGFVAFPQIDLAFARFFTVDGRSFHADSHWLFHAFSGAITLIGHALSAILVISLAISSFSQVARARAGQWLREQRRVSAFLLLSLIIGPGLLVNGFKAITGRARPEEVREFGGTSRFTPAFVISDQCGHNCSFVSGDAAGATFAVAGCFIAGSRRARKAWLIGGLSFGALVGLARIMSGRHFLSDVFVGMALTYVVLALCAECLLRGGRSRGAGRRG